MDLNDSPGFLINKLARFMMNELERRLRTYGITTSQWAVLAVLWQKPGLTQAQLHQALGLDKATVTGIIQRMIKAGFIRREPDPGDKRIQRVFVTGRGKQLEEQLVPLAKEVNEQMLRPFTPAERDQFIRMIRAATHSIDSEK